MRDTYSLYETKARLSAIIRQVREGHRVVVTVHGNPVAEIRPIAPSGDTLEQRLGSLAERGIVVRSAKPASKRQAIVRRPGALTRFLADRDP